MALHKRGVRVGAIRQVAHGIKHLTLFAADGLALPPVEAGSHIDLWLPGGLVRQYSVIEADGNSYSIAVQREPHSRGGSAFIVDQLRTDTALQISGPRCSFQLDAGDEHSILIAGGIGITPILPMARQLQAQGKVFAFHYMARSRAQVALLDAIERSGLQHTLQLHVSAEQGRADLRALLGAPREKTGIYVCGPARLIEGVLEAARDWPGNAVHFERFAAADAEAPVPARAFEVELKQSGKVLTVAADQSILQVLRAERIAMESLCGEGVCGTCAVGLLAGQADHRDSLQTEEEKKRNDTIYVCVSRAQSVRIVLDL